MSVTLILVACLERVFILQSTAQRVINMCMASVVALVVPRTKISPAMFAQGESLLLTLMKNVLYCTNM